MQKDVEFQFDVQYVISCNDFSLQQLYNFDANLRETRTVNLHIDTLASRGMFCHMG